MADLSSIKVGDTVLIRSRFGENFTRRVVRLTKRWVITDDGQRFRREGVRAGTRPCDDGWGNIWQVIDGIAVE